jgi:hypothetical protein
LILSLTTLNPAATGGQNRINLAAKTAKLAATGGQAGARGESGRSVL